MTSTALDLLGQSPYVSLETFRRTGVAVPTAVWIGRSGDALIVTTALASGKVKRLRNDPRVRLTPCDRQGVLDAGAVAVDGTAEILDDAHSAASLYEIFEAKYGQRFVDVRAAGEVRRKGAPSVVLRITLD
jgi:PPOX class probable F420-dependent enzyme